MDPSGLQTEPAPHHPNVKQEEGGLFCFMDKERPCSAECMAYLDDRDVPLTPEYQDRQWPRCLLLVNAHRTGKHLVVLASVAGKMKSTADDQARASQPAPPVPR